MGASKWEINLGLQVDIGTTIGWTRLGGVESHYAEAGEVMSQERCSLSPVGALLLSEPMITLIDQWGLL